MNVDRGRLLQLLARLSYKTGDFVLSSGQRSSFYIDCRITTLHAEGGRVAGRVLLEIIRERCPHAVAVGGLTLGADPVVSNVASASAWELADYNELRELAPDEDQGVEPTLLHGFLVRKSEKTHGTGRRIEGFLEREAPVVIVDDVCTTGGSTITAIEAVRDAGMVVAGVFCLVDREQGGREAIEQALAELPARANVPFIAVFTEAEVRCAHAAIAP